MSSKPFWGEWEAEASFYHRLAFAALKDDPEANQKLYEHFQQKAFSIAERGMARYIAFLKKGSPTNA